MKKSIALLSVLIFITILFAIVGSIYSIYQKLSDNNFYKNISQNSILIINTKTILDNISKEINSSLELKEFFNTFAISSKNGNFRALITIKPLLNRVNINDLKNNRKKKYILNYLDNILNYYQINDPLFFENIILDTLDNDKEERMGGSEIILQFPFFKQGRIYNYSHFKKILNYYAKNRDDKNIYKIPWKKLFTFLPSEYNMDCDLLNKQVVKFLSLEHKNISCEDLYSFNQNKKILQALNIQKFDKTENYPLEINILYEENSLNIIYDINKKKIKKIYLKPVYN